VKLNFDDLPHAAQAMILKFTASDYVFLKDYYRAPEMGA
jgi:hypothetical protein